MGGDDSWGCGATPRGQQKLDSRFMLHHRKAHQDPRVRPIVICEEERLWIRFQQNIPVEEVHADCDALAILLQPREKLLAKEKRRSAV